MYLKLSRHFFYEASISQDQLRTLSLTPWVWNVFLEVPHQLPITPSKQFPKMSSPHKERPHSDKGKIIAHVSFNEAGALSNHSPPTTRWCSKPPSLHTETNSFAQVPHFGRLYPHCFIHWLKTADGWNMVWYTGSFASFLSFLCTM